MNLSVLSSMSARTSRAAASLGIVVAAAVALAVVRVPGAEGAFVARITNSVDSAGVNTGCTAWAQDKTVGPALFTYPLGDATTSSSTAADVSGAGNSGSYSAQGVTAKQTNSGACAKDGYSAVLLNGSSGAIYGPSTAMSNPQTFTEEIWFNTTTAGGKLIGFGSSQTGSSTNYDRHLYLDTSGHVVFGVYPGSVQTAVSPKTYIDGKWHFAAATLSSAGMQLYVDGAPVASNTTTSAQNYSGYWRIGYDNLANWGSTAPSNYYFKGNLAWASVYTTALSAAQISAQYTAGS